MASPQASVKLFSSLDIDMYDVDADYSTAAVVVASVTDMRDVARFAAVAMTSAKGGNGMTKLEIIGCTAAAGTGDITVIKTSGVVAADTVGNFAAVECTAEELRQEAADAGAALRYCAVRLTNHHADDEVVLTVIRDGLRFAGAGKTANVLT